MTAWQWLFWINVPIGLVLEVAFALGELIAAEPMTPMRFFRLRSLPRVSCEGLQSFIERREAHFKGL